jgi:RNA recognition motif-containing protein
MNDMTTNNPIPSISSRLVIKNIPENFSDDQLIELIKKNFEIRIKNITIIKLEHKYSKNNKLCYLTTDNLDTRREIIQFFNGFELIDPKGFKQKLSIVDCLYQNILKTQKDKILNTIDQSKILFNNQNQNLFYNSRPFH